MDYREKIEKKISEGKLKCGDLYAQKCCGLPNFEIILFAWIDADPAKNYDHYSRILDFAQKVLKSINKKTASMLIPYSAEMGEMKEVVRTIAASLEKMEHLSEVSLSSNDSKVYKGFIDVYGSYIKKLVDENKISID